MEHKEKRQRTGKESDSALITSLPDPSLSSSHDLVALSPALLIPPDDLVKPQAKIKVLLDDPDGSKCILYSNRIPDTLLENVWHYLLSRKSEMTRDRFVIFGRPCFSRYKSMAFGDIPGKTFEYAGMSRPCEEMPSDILNLRDYIVQNFTDGSYPLNYILTNYYATSEDYVGLHGDKVQSHQSGSMIVSLSLGATRQFSILSNKPKSTPIVLSLTHGTVLTMSLPMQRSYRHQLVKGYSCPFRDRHQKTSYERFCLTFRSMIN